MLPIYEIRKSDLTVKRNNYQLMFPEHIHKYIEIMYVFKGSQRIKIKDHEYMINKGEAAIIFPETVHSYTGDGVSDADVLILICAPKSFGKLFPDLNKLRAINPVISENEIVPELKAAFEMIRPEHSIGIKFSWACVIMSYIMETIQLENVSYAPVEDITYKIIKFIEENFTENITRKILAKKFNVSESYISVIFTDKFNMNLRNYLGVIRAEYAAGLIRTTNETFTVISRLSGFESLRTFNRIFKSVYGMTPGAYKKNINRMMKNT